MSMVTNAAHLLRNAALPHFFWSAAKTPALEEKLNLGVFVAI
jgi:hypothetical protein